MKLHLITIMLTKIVDIVKKLNIHQLIQQKSIALIINVTQLLTSTQSQMPKFV